MLFRAIATLLLFSTANLSLAQQPNRWVKCPHNGLYYTLTSRPMTWVQAEDEARSLGGHLATVSGRNIAAVNELNNWFGATFRVDDPGDELWIGLNDAKVSGKFVWSSGQALNPSLARWGKGQPDNGGANPPANYVVLTSLPYFTWDDVKGSELHYGIVESSKIPTYSISTDIGQGCKGSNSKVPELYVATGAVPGKVFSLGLQSAKANSGALLFLGFLPVTLDLTAFGAPGCKLYTSGIGLFHPTNQAGAWGTLVGLPIPNNPSLIGMKLYTQALPFDLMANKLHFVSSNAIRTVVGRGIHPGYVRIEKNSVWNDQVYISWQNVKHVYQNSSINMAIDTIKYDDNGDGDPRNDRNRVLLDPVKKDGAFGIGLYMDNFSLGNTKGVKPASITRNRDGSVTVRISRSVAGVGSADTYYTILPHDRNIYGKLVLKPAKTLFFSWSYSMISSVWVTRGPGQMVQYDLAGLPGKVLKASSTYGFGSTKQGIDYLQQNNVYTGYASFGSTKNGWANGIVLSQSPVPLVARSYVVMHSKYGGWGFTRGANLVHMGLPVGKTYTFDVIFRGDYGHSFKGIEAQWKDSVGKGTNVALSSNGAIARASSQGTYVGKTQFARYVNDGNYSKAWASSGWNSSRTPAPEWVEVKFAKIHPINKVAVTTHYQSFTIDVETSVNGTTWTPVVRGFKTVNRYAPKSSEGVNRVEFPIQTRQALYVRVLYRSRIAPPTHIFQAICGEIEAFTP